MYALDIACKAIYAGECEAAVVGGVNLIITVDQQMNTARMGVLSATNQCHTFDEAADGYSRADGVGALYIKPLAAALLDGDPIRAIIRSTAINCNGRGDEGIMHPNVDGQADAISLAYELGHLEPKHTFYVECHGTGTPVGDPIEVEALQRALGKHRAQADPLLIGSVKPNIGHSEAASSMGTLIKAILSLENGIIPPTAGIAKLNSSIPWSEYNVKVVTEPTSFSASVSTLRIGVSAFGYGGTNAHAVLESVRSIAPDYRGHKYLQDSAILLRELQSHDVSDSYAQRPHLIVFSAHDKPTLKHNIINVSNKCQDVDLIDLGYTLGLRRTKLAQRAFAIAHAGSARTDILAAITTISLESKVKPKIAFAFTGQGSQWPNMGAELISLFPVALQTIRRLDHHLSTLQSPPMWRLEDLLANSNTTGIIDQPEYSQPLCTALQIAILDLMAVWGIKPLAVIGHSSGEIAAAYAAGHTTAEDAITASYLRGKVTSFIQSDGAMLAVGLGAETAAEYVQLLSHRGTIGIGCYNSPKSVTVSGDSQLIEELEQRLSTDRVFLRRLKTGGKAYHSAHVVASASPYHQLLAQEMSSTTRAPRGDEVPMFSTVKQNCIIRKNRDMSDTYWIENLVNPVLFNHGLQNLLTTMPGINTIIEIGPHSSLAGSIRQICQAVSKEEISYIPTLKREGRDGDQMLHLAGRLWAEEYPLNLLAVNKAEELVGSENALRERTGSLLVDLPTYHWTYSKLELSEPRLSKEHRTAKEPRHDILGRRIIGSSTLDPAWRNVLRLQDVPWLAQHRIGGEVLLPAAAYLALAIEAVTQINSQLDQPQIISSYTLRNVSVSSATAVPDNDTGIETRFRLQQLNKDSGNDAQWYQFYSLCYSDGLWKESARGVIAVNAKGRGAQRQCQLLSDTPFESSFKEFQDRHRDLGIDLGPAFHHIKTISSDRESYIARAAMKVGSTCGLMEKESRYVFHPTALDSCMQPYMFTASRGRIEEVRCGAIPMSFAETTIYVPRPDQLIDECKLQSWTDPIGNRAFTANSQLLAPDGLVLVDIVGCRNLLYAAAMPQKINGLSQRDLYQKLEWQPDIDYLSWAQKANLLTKDPLTTLISLVLHKNPAPRILCFDKTVASSILQARPDAAKAFHHATLDDTDLEIEPNSNVQIHGPFSLIIVPKVQFLPSKVLAKFRTMLESNGRVFLPASEGVTEEWCHGQKSLGLRVDVSIPHGIIMAATVADSDIKPPVRGESLAPENQVLLLYQTTPTRLSSVVSELLGDNGWRVNDCPLDSASHLEAKFVVLLDDAAEPMLSSLTTERLNLLMKLSDRDSSIVWVTRGGLLSGDFPEFGLTQGLARCLRRERASMNLVTIDFDGNSTSDSCLAILIRDIMSQYDRAERPYETEYYFKDGVAHVSRIVSHQSVHQRFVPDSGQFVTVHQRSRPAIKAALENGSLVFYDDITAMQKALGDDEVEIRVAAIGIEAPDGTDDANFLNHQVAGIVTRVGPNVLDITTGTEVFGFAFGKMETFQRTLCHLVQPLPVNCSLAVASSLPSPCVTALYGLEQLARVQPREIVAIVDGIGSTGIAAAQICRHIGAVPVVITNSLITRDLLLGSNLTGPNQIILTSEDELSAQIESATAGAGFDIVISSLVNNRAIATECIQHLGTMGRLVMIGQADYDNPLSTRIFSSPKSISVFQFTLKDVVDKQPLLVKRLLQKCIENYTEKCFEPIQALVSKGPANVQGVLQTTSRGNIRLDNYVLSYDDLVTFPVSPSRERLKLKDSATYLMVGCLGALGQKLAFWMAERGAKHLTFLSRTGTDNPDAEATVQHLKHLGLQINVFRVDIRDRLQLQQAIHDTESVRPIRGVVHAAAVLRDIMFPNMTIESWNTVVDIKVKGALNLHWLLRDNQLDFFVMTSSIAATMGSAGQTNYAAANCFLDTLARHRRLRGLPAVSLIIPPVSGVGIIQDRSEIRRAMEAKGLYTVPWQEVLSVFEIAMRPLDCLPSDADHIIVGLQPRPLAQSMRAANTLELVAEDLRMRWLQFRIGEEMDDGTQLQSKNRVHDTIAKMVQQAPTQEQAFEIVTLHITRRLARLVMIDVESIEPSRHSLPSLGIDSMIGSEFRNWIFREFMLDIPFQQLFSGGRTIFDLSRRLCEHLRAS